MNKWTNEELKEKRLKFALWLATPDNVRVIKNQKDFAKELGLPPETLSKWRSYPDVVQMKENAVGFLLGDVLWEVIEKTKEAAKSGNAQDRRLYFQLSGHLAKDKREKKDIPTEAKIIIESADNADKTELEGAGEISS